MHFPQFVTTLNAKKCSLTMCASREGSYEPQLAGAAFKEHDAAQAAFMCHVPPRHRVDGPALTQTIVRG